MSNSPAFSNRLIHEKSPYLLQHAHNPVEWHPWGKDAFNEARARDKPVLLSVGYSTCHWCHVMAHESFENKDIAQMINDHFVAIKVDREERPDVDHIYMTAVTAMTGRGGWPLTVFLTPKGEPFYGGTYFSPYTQGANVGFIDLLDSVTKAWDTDRENILSSSRLITESLQKQARRKASGEVLDETLCDKAYRQLKEQFDAINGGFGGAPKFPMGHNLSFLLRVYKRCGEKEALDMAEKTLTAMLRGGIWDHLGGGFHRYSTDQGWHVPHFEKMLYDQALLSRAYLEAYQVTGRAVYARAAREILDYVLREVTDPEGGFYCAQDADSPESVGGHSKEGAFYIFSRSEIVETLGADAAEVFNYCYAVSPEGNASFDPHAEFKGKNILYLAHGTEDAAKKFHKQVHGIELLLSQARAKLLARRDQRPRPHLDDKVLTDWNGLMMASMCFGSRVLGKQKYRQAGAKAADFILTHLMANGRLLHRWRKGEAGIPATLEDYAFFIYGLLDVYEAAFEEKYLDMAKTLADGMIDLFADKEGGFYMTSSDAEGLIMRPMEAYDGALPSGNSVAALSLLKLSVLTQKASYKSKAAALLSFFSPSVGQNPHSYAFLLSALDWYFQGAMEITLEGALDDPAIAKMLKIMYKYFIPYKAVRFIPAKTLGARICYRGTCHPVVVSPDIFEKLLLGM